MRTTTIVFALVLSISGPALAQDWTEYVNTQEGFKVDLPGQPKLTEMTWNARPLQGDAAEAVAELKQRNGENLLKFGPGSFSRTLIENGLLDELHVWIFPVLVGGGQRLIDGIDVTHLELVESTPFESGIVVNAYAPKA